MTPKNNTCLRCQRRPNYCICHPLKSPAFDKLQAEWYAKAKDSGFDDIESDENNLTDWHSSHFAKNFDATKYQATTEYYQMASKCLHDPEFFKAAKSTVSGRRSNPKKDREIWEMHCDGLTPTDIAERLSSTRDSVVGIIDRLNKKMRGIVRG